MLELLVLIFVLVWAFIIRPLAECDRMHDRVYSGGGALANAPTYICAYDNLDPAPIERAMAAAGIALAGTPDNTTIFFCEGAALWSRPLVAASGLIKFRLNAPAVTNKYNLYTILAQTAPALIPQTVFLSGANAIARTVATAHASINKRLVWVLRNDRGWSGSGVRVSETPQEFDKYEAELRSQTGDKTRGKPAQVMASRYLTELALFGGRKCHIRAFVIAACAVVDGILVRRAWMLRNFIIVCAREMFAARDWHNPVIHDTHMNDAANIFYCVDASADAHADAPRILDSAGAGVSVEVESQKIINADFADALRRAFEAIMRANGPQLYPESPAAYEVYGADLMVTNTGAVKIIEINDKPGFKPPLLRGILSQWINDATLYVVNDLLTMLNMRAFTAQVPSGAKGELIQLM